MGEYSHYCNVSRITIRPGQKCVLIPLVNAQGTASDLDWCVSALPIYGTYTGYGSLENVECDHNTDLIADHYGVPIELFTEHVMRMGYSNGVEYHNIDNWMLVDRQVWDNLTSNRLAPRWGDDHDIGNKHLLTFLGFQYIGEHEETVRYKHKWQLGDTIVYADGSWLQLGPNDNDESIYRLADLFEVVPGINPDYIKLVDTSKAQNWRLYLDDSKIMDRYLGYVLNQRSYFADKKMSSGEAATLDMSLTLEEQLALLQEELPFDEENYNSPDALDAWVHNTRISNRRDYINQQYSLSSKYLGKLELFGDEIAKLDTMLSNIRVMSLSFEPQYQNYTTPQYGEYETHSKILGMFKMINDSYIPED